MENKEFDISLENVDKIEEIIEKDAKQAFTLDEALRKVGQDVSSRIPSSGIPILLKAATMGNVKAMNDLGIAYHHDNDFHEATYWLKEAIKNGYVLAYANLGPIYIENGDFDNALKVLEEGCKANQSESYFELAHIYDQGIAVERNLDQAYKLYEKGFAAHNEINGRAKCSIKLGLFNEHGLIVPKNEKQAFVHYYWAAQTGDSGGKAQLGRALLHGIGCEKNIPLAYYYLSNAAEDGLEKVIPLIMEIVSDEKGELFSPDLMEYWLTVGIQYNERRSYFEYAKFIMDGKYHPRNATLFKRAMYRFFDKNYPEQAEIDEIYSLRKYYGDEEFWNMLTKHFNKVIEKYQLENPCFEDLEIPPTGDDIYDIDMIKCDA